MAEEGVAMVEASAAAAATSVAAAAVSVAVAAISVAAAAVSVVVVAISAIVAVSAGLAGVVLVAIDLRNTEEGISSTGIASSTEIVSGTIATSFLEVPFCMITPTTGTIIIRTTGMTIRTTGMIIIRTGTTDIRTIDRTTAFADSWFQTGRHELSHR
jgi:hypothetical protein